MSDVATNGHLSIGEVLSLVQEDFPDVTISKIRFLESQGLIAPERTASGYRKFYDADIDRLRWILGQQRDHFLPLKVIKRMLDQGVDVADASQVQPSLFSSSAPDSDADSGEEPTSSEAAPSGATDDEPARPRSPAHPAVASAPKASRRGAASRRETAVAPEEASGPTRKHATPADVVAALQEDPRNVGPRTAAERTRAATGAGDEDAPEPTPATATRSGALGASETGETMTREELCADTGVSEELLADLESYGLITPASLGGTPTYDAEGQMVARLAARYVELGVEPRHLRMYKVAAEREAGFIEQLVVPLLKQRNPAAREQAVERTDELLSMGAQLHGVLLRRQVGPALGG
jgi:DNA-binding transcriptional MerR regulator